MLATRNTKTIDNGDGTLTEISSPIGLHYESILDSGVYDAEVNCRTERVNNAVFDGWRVTQNDWHYALGQPAEKTSDGWVGFGGRQGQNWFKFRLAKVGYLHWPSRAWQDVGGSPNYDRANLTQETKSRELLGSTHNLATIAKWQNLWTTPGSGEIYTQWRVDGSRLKEDIVINQAGRDWINTNRPPTTSITDTYFGFVFELDWSDISNVVIGGQSQNIAADFNTDTTAVELQDALNRTLAFMPVDTVYVGDEKERFGTTLKRRFWHDADKYYLMIGIRVDTLNDLPSGDLIFDPTVTPTPAASADDNIAYGATCDSTTTSQYVGNDGTANDNGLRFVLNVPAGATISAAKLTFEARANLTNDTVRTKISYQDADDPGDFSGCTAASFAGRTRSATVVDWDFTTDWTTGNFYDSDDISTVIQDLVNEAYWASGEHCVLFVDDDGSDSGAYRRSYSWDSGSGDPVMLTVTYSTSSNVPIFYHHLQNQGIT